jgi:hypothetical protein
VPTVPRAAALVTLLCAGFATGACRRAAAPSPAPPAGATAGPGALPARASAPAPAPAGSAPEAADVTTEFMRVNHVDLVIDSWVAEMERQWNQQVLAMQVKPPPTFWADSVAEFDMASERSAVRAAVSAGIPESEMRDDVAWMKQPGMTGLAAKLDELSRSVGPIHAALGLEAERAAARAGGRPEPAARPIVVPALTLASSEREEVHRLMERLGYGPPAVLAPRLVDALRIAIPNQPDATWTDAGLRRASEDAARAIEAEFARIWPPGEAAAVARLLDSPEGIRHDALMERLMPLVMTRSQPFMEKLQKHVLRRYARIFNVAWEERERRKQRGAP